MFPLATVTALAAARESDLRQQAQRAKQAKLARRHPRRVTPKPPTSRWRHWPTPRTA